MIPIAQCHNFVSTGMIDDLLFHADQTINFTNKKVDSFNGFINVDLFAPIKLKMPLTISFVSAAEVTYADWQPFNVIVGIVDSTP